MAGINGFLRVIGIAILPVAGLMIWAQFRMHATLQEGVTNTVAALVAMIPQGLVLMCSIAFAVAAVTLARRKVLTRELPAVEGLARVDVLCIDKTGTITEPQPAFERVELLGEAAADSEAAPSGEGPAPGGARQQTPARAAEEALALQVLGALAGYRIPRQLDSQRHKGSHRSSDRLDGRGRGALLLGPQVERDPAERAWLLGARRAGDRRP